MLRNLLIGLAVIFFSTIAIIGYLLYTLWDQNSNKRLLQRLEVPDRGVAFVLMTDLSGIEDRAWYVYELPSGVEPTEQMKKGHDLEGVLFWNYSEAGDHYLDPKLELVEERFLVFSRGGFHHSVYDLERKRTLVNSENPWQGFMQSEQHKKYGELPPPGGSGSAMDVWVFRNLHLKVKKAIREKREPTG